MIVCYRDATLVTSQGIHHEPLVIDTFWGKILPPEKASRARHTIDASHLIFYPGLINAHDHLEFNHYPRTRWRERYDNASAWATDMQPQLDKEPFITLQKMPLEDRCLIGGLKNLLSGVTTVAHHNPPHKPLFKDWFPVRVLQRYQWTHSLYLVPGSEIQKAYHRTGRGVFMLHLAEGTDQAANDELIQLESLGCLSERTLLIHGVGLRGENLQKAVQESAGLVWCPSSNLFLLGQTAPVQEWYKAGKLALGSDSRLTADGDLLDELRAAHATGGLDPEALFHLVTDYPARLLKLPQVGDLQPGMRADVLALRQPIQGNVYEQLIQSWRTDIEWVMRDGKILWGRNPLKANCYLEDVPYHLDPSILKRLEKSRLQEPLLAMRR
jgi:cytosine/adenosine deaminase-related metal-dependent hydrolase